MKASGSQSPGDGETVIGDIRADGSGLDRRRKQFTERRVIFGYLVEREANRLGHRDPGTLGGRSCAPIATCESDCTLEFSAKRFYLIFRFLCARFVAEFAGFFQFVFEFGQSALISGLRLSIQRLACMPQVPGDRVGSSEVLCTCLF